jgi:hypothetical protein
VKTCAYCGTRTSTDLCASCGLGIAKYPEQNPPILDAYIARGMQQIEASLRHHAEFDVWLATHPDKR